VTERAARNRAKSDVRTATRFPRTNRRSDATSTVRLFNLIVSAVSTGPPTARPSAYPVTSAPAAGDGDLQVGGDQAQHADHEQLGAPRHEHAQEQRGQDQVPPAPGRSGTDPSSWHHASSEAEELV
jgi:hypothetical protein